MSSTCFVPKCENSVGILFPEDPDLTKKWLEILKIDDVLPNSDNFVCIDHFEGGPGHPAGEINIINKLPRIPLELCPDANKVKTFIDNVGTDDVMYNNKATENYLIEQPQEITKEYLIGNCDENGTAKHHDKILQMDDETEHLQNIKRPPEVLMFNSKSCRMCMKTEKHTKNIFEHEVEENVPIALAILACIYPIEISKNDPLPKYICQKCLELLKSYFKFRSTVLKNDKHQRQFYNTSSSLKDCNALENVKRKSNPIHSSSSKKLKTDESTEYEYENLEELESLSEFLVKKEILEPTESRTNISSPPPLVPISSSKPSKSDTDKKLDKVEELLRQVIEHNLTEEQAKAENIIIHVQNDKEFCEPVATLSNLKLPIVIKPYSPNKPNPDQSTLAGRRRIIDGDKKKVVLTGINLPKGIKLSVKEKFKSDIGIFHGIPVGYVFDVEFCIVDEYLYEYRLCKGNLRYLRCVLPTCRAIGTQNKIQNGVYSNEVNVTQAHNHEKPTVSERKKQMFFFVMKRKMQSDRTSNFRCVYEDVCKKDPEIRSLVPLRNVINEICRHQLNYKSPIINSFEQFYDHIEDDSFHKLQFTHHGKQFYQEKFTAEDNSKAIVFANSDIIDAVCSSNLLYVDSSFKIDTTEKFKYHLVTVLVWVHDSYYPILFALVSKKSQEIYKKIFEYLHHTLAPKLQPEEIVTDYEANLYYALGETYLESSIGGSVFYYTQNLYKKICSLNLCRDLETNSYFRNVYHMLLMLPLLPVNTILDGLNNMETQAKDLGLYDLTRPIFEHVRLEWIMKVTPELFCVHRLENRINENVIAPFKKLRDFLMLSKGKMQKQALTISHVVERLIELENFLQTVYSSSHKKSFARDLSSSQKKNVLKAWLYIENHPKININNFFTKVLGYIKCMENQLWIWGFYRYTGGVNDELINATNFSIVSTDVEVVTQNMAEEDIENEFIDIEEHVEPDEEEHDSLSNEEEENGHVVMEAVIDENGSFVLQDKQNHESTAMRNTILKYISQDSSE